MRDSRPPAAIVAALGSAAPDGAGVVAAAPCNMVRVYELRGHPATKSASTDPSAATMAAGAYKFWQGQAPGTEAKEALALVRCNAAEFDAACSAVPPPPAKVERN